MVTKPA
jgi:hypothetical protein